MRTSDAPTTTVGYSLSCDTGSTLLRSLFHSHLSTCPSCSVSTPSTEMADGAATQASWKPAGQELCVRDTKVGHRVQDRATKMVLAWTVLRVGHHGMLWEAFGWIMIQTWLGTSASRT